MHPFAVAGVVLCAALQPATGLAGSEDAGQAVFAEACASCHGANAKGNGPHAAMLSVPVPDLTSFARRNDGDFDRARVVRLIDGREGLAAHGGPMPMFGGLLTGPSVVIDGPGGSPVTTTAPILAIVDWLASVQEP
ncbi:c-type cytochrome [Tropicimonas isoalkanivorans]|uniref:Cytochrome c n=1 Tax=Tropicimonas isoalkanivorans TaxID=441112 RepID=A0A1I1MWH8_9RHOB|nr:cytochrome c [Tropicimonas isoalkanivorans]SFC89794.1 Cytochrome c [Tropicimonas isoalkanivorans]